VSWTDAVEAAGGSFTGAYWIMFEVRLHK